MRMIAVLLLAAIPALADTSPKRDGPGWIWIAEQGAGRVIALNSGGQVVWSKDGLTSVRDVNFRPNGNILAGGLDAKVREITRDGRIVWEYTAPQPVYSVRPLANGNVLVGHHNAVIEVTRGGEIVWEYSGGTCPEDIQPLQGGQVLIAWYGAGKAEVVDRDKRVIRTVASGAPMGVQQTRDGKILVCDVRAHTVTVLDPEGKATWEYSSYADTPHASMTRSGEVLVSTWSRVLRVGRDGQVKWSHEGLRQAIKVREH